MVKVAAPLYHNPEPRKQDRDSACKRGYDRKWQAYRRRYLAAHPWCELHMNDVHVYVIATVVDHIRPHKGNQQLFWDPSNHRPLCKECHDRHGAKA